MINNNNFSIAVIEDDSSLRKDLVEYLLWRGFQVSGFESAEACYLEWPNIDVDLAIIDICLPGENGLQAAAWMQRQQPNIGIVMLSALGESSDQVSGLETGADAYLVKGASLEVIEATCRSVLRRTSPDRNHPAVNSEKEGWLLSTHAWSLIAPDQQSVPLTHTEFIFLEHLIKRAGETVSRVSLLNALGKQDTLSNQRNLDNHVSRLRRKLKNEINQELPIRPSYGSGYTFISEGWVER